MDGAFANTTSLSTPSWIGHVLTVVLALVVTLGLLLVLSRWAIRKKHLWQTQQSIRSVATLVLAPHKTVHIIEIAQTLYIIGVADNITVLDKIADEHACAVLRTPASDRRPTPHMLAGRSIAAQPPERIRTMVEQKLRRAVTRS